MQKKKFFWRSQCIFFREKKIVNLAGKNKRKKKNIKK